MWLIICWYFHSLSRLLLGSGCFLGGFTLNFYVENMFKTQSSYRNNRYGTLFLKHLVAVMIGFERKRICPLRGFALVRDLSFLRILFVWSTHNRYKTYFDLLSYWKLTEKRLWEEIDQKKSVWICKFLEQWVVYIKLVCNTSGLNTITFQLDSHQLRSN